MIHQFALKTGAQQFCHKQWLLLCDTEQKPVVHIFNWLVPKHTRFSLGHGLEVSAYFAGIVLWGHFGALSMQGKEHALFFC